MKMIRLLYAVPLILLSACYTLEPPCIFGPTPLLSITAVTGGETSLSEVTLSNFGFEGAPASPQTLFEIDQKTGSPEANTTFVNDTILCELPCRFGFEAEEGKYAFDVSAAGYKTERTEVEAEYEMLPPARCSPSRATKVRLELDLEPLNN